MRPNMRPTEKTDLKGALRSLTVYLQKSLGVILLALVLAALSAVLTIIGPDQVGKIATLMSEGSAASTLPRWRASACCWP